MGVLWSYTHGMRGTLAGLLLLELASNGAALAQPLVVRAVVDGLEAGKDLVGPVVLLAVIALAGLVLTWLSTYLLERFGQRIVLRVRHRLVRRILGAPVSVVEGRPVGDFLSRVGSDTTVLRHTVTGMLVHGAAAPLTITAAVLMMAGIDPVLLAIVVTMFGLSAVVAVWVLDRVGRASEEAQGHLGGLTSVLQRALVAFRTIKASGTEEHEWGLARQAAHLSYRAAVRAGRSEATVEVVAVTGIELSFIVVLLVGTARTAAGALTLSDLIAFLLYVVYLRGPVETLAMVGSSFAEGLAAVRRVREVEILPSEVDSRPAAVASPSPPGALSGQSTRSTRSTRSGREDGDGPEGRRGNAVLRLEDVWFGYDGRPILRGVTVDVHRGLTVLAGPSGAGKTTVLSLLERFADVERGRILLHGADLRGLDRGDLRRRLGYVQQDAPVLGGTIGESVLYGVPDATRADVAGALRTVGLWSWVGALPSGVDTPVGERGVAISGGQRQRLAVARALLRDPEVLLLDEATSQLDARSERILLRAIVEQAAHRVVLAVTHRMAIASLADQVVLLDDGRVRALGGHDALLSSDALYQELLALPPPAPAHDRRR
ncbi:ABC transporter ATP-binding protein [Streptosporangium violaceochromogenes]|nr:ABC transporter ATP-binding protein [Streptosporangium violaceochromogenes]